MKRISVLIILIIFGFSTQDLAAQTSKSKKKKFSFANIFKPKNKRKNNNSKRGKTAVRSHNKGGKSTTHSSSKLNRKNRNKKGITSSKTRSASNNSNSRTKVREYDTSKYEPRKNTTKTDDDFKYDNYSSKTVLQKAYRYMGVPYVWGGSTPQGFDCSGFTQYVMRESGYQIPRTSSQQSKHGKKVTSRKLRSGDLVFFGDRKGDISHVGMVTSKKGKYFSMIHASSSKGVSVVDVNDSSYFQKRYQVARRVSK